VAAAPNRLRSVPWRTRRTHPAAISAWRIRCVTASTNTTALTAARIGRRTRLVLATQRSLSPRSEPGGMTRADVGDACCERIWERNAALPPRMLGTRRNGSDDLFIVICRFETRETSRDGNRLAHNSAVAASSSVVVYSTSMTRNRKESSDCDESCESSNYLAAQRQNGTQPGSSGNSDR
jgi:hypothetical protein